MKTTDKTKKELLDELAELKKQIRKLEAVQRKILRTSENIPAETQYQIVFNSLPDAAAIHDLKGHFLSVNDTLCKRLGYSRKELLHMTPKDIDTEVNANLVQKRIHALKKKGHLVFETAHLSRKGKVIPAEVYSRIIDYEGGKAVLSVARDIRKRKQIEEAMRESEERFRMLVESAPEAIFVQSQGLFVYLNRAMLSLLGALTPKELLGKEIMNYIAPEYHEAIRKRIRIQRETGNPVPNMDQEYIRLDGMRVLVETTAVAIRYQGVGAHLVFVRDISERKKIESELKLSEEKYRLLFHGIRDAVYVHEVYHDKPGKFIAVNEAACKMLGYTEEELMQMTVQDIDVPEQAKNVPAIHEQLFTKGHALFETCHIAKAGKRIPVEINLRMFELRGKSMVLSVARDITERKDVGKSLKESEERYSTMINASPNIVFIHKHGIIHYINEYGRKLMGYQRVELIGRPIFEFLADDSKEIVTKNIKRRIAGEHVENYEVNVVTKSKDVRSFIVSASVIPYEGDKAFLSVLSDITAHKRAEEVLVSKMNELERLNKLFIGREMRMIEMKSEVNELLQKLGQPKKYSTPDEVKKAYGHETSE